MQYSTIVVQLIVCFFFKILLIFSHTTIISSLSLSLYIIINIIIFFKNKQLYLNILQENFFPFSIALYLFDKSHHLLREGFLLCLDVLIQVSNNIKLERKIILKFQRQMKRIQPDILGPLMCIKSNLEKGLRISWNFGGLITENDLNCFHLFIFINTRESQCQQVLNKYYDRMKLGDLLGIFPRLEYKKDQQKIKWTQKTTFELEQHFIDQNYILDIFDNSSMKYLLILLSKMNGLIAINIIINSVKSELKKKITQLEKDISHIRSTNPQSDKFIFNILADFDKNILVNSLIGINYFRYERYSMKSTANQIINYLKIISIKKLRITLQINGNTQCKIAHAFQWKITETSSIQKTYYAIPSCNFDEYLIFLTDQQENKELQIVVIMEVSFFNRKQIRAKNEIRHEVSSSFLKLYTINASQNIYGKTKFANNEFVQTNLCERKSYFWIYEPNNV